jgi:hypothetical protein
MGLFRRRVPGHYIPIHPDNIAKAVPSLRRSPGGKRLVSFDEVMDALRALDKLAQGGRTGARPSWRRSLRRRDPSDEGEGRSLG